MDARAQSGFTLVEVIVVIVIISVGLLGVTGLFGTAIRAVSANQDMQTVGQFAQSCAEEVMAAHRKANLALASSVPALCAGTRSGYTRTLVVGAQYMDVSAKPWCPSQVTCRDVTIEAVSTINPTIRARVNLMLAGY